MSIHPFAQGRFCARLNPNWRLLAALWLLPLAAPGVPPVEFKTPPSFPVGQSPGQIVTADFNRDGIPDLATADFFGHTVSVLLGRGEGLFAPVTTYGVGQGPDSLAVGDFNDDGWIDVITADSQGWNAPGTLSLLRGRGDGTFDPATSVAVGRGPRGVTAADFNGDGRLDVATAISGGWFETNKVNVLLGRGDGTFDPPAWDNVGTSPEWIASGDFNGDGRPDLVVVNAGPQASGNTASVLLNTGDGTFHPATNYTVGTYPRFVLAADFNGDGKLDFAVASGSLTSVLLGRGDGTFDPANNIPVASGITQLAAGDFNGDTRLDLAALGGSYDAGAVSVLLGTGTGSFNGPTSYSIGAALEAIAAGDLDSDGNIDLAVAGGYDNAVLLMQGNGDGSFKSSTDTYAVGAGIHGMITGDFNHDAQLDLVTVNHDAHTASVLIQQTNGLFRPAVHYPVGSQPRAVKTGDFNNDGWLDLVVASFDGTLTLLRGRTTAPGVFTNRWSSGFLGTVTLGSNHTDVAVGSFNSGTHLDIVTPNYYGASLSVALGVGDGTFHTPPPPALAVNSGPTCVVVDDFNGDGKADIAAGYESGLKISVLTGRGDGTFNPKIDIDTWEIPWFIAAGDFNFDGRPDLVAAHYDWRRISVMINTGPAGGPVAFAPPVMHDVANDPVSVALGDFNGDNRLDIASGNFASVSVLLGFGDGTFSTATNYFVGGKYVTAADFNRDGMPDLAIDLGGKVGLFWNETLPRLQIEPAGPNVRIAWPAWYAYQIETASDLGVGSVWTSVTNSPAVVGSQYVLTNAPTGANQVYRLKRQ